MARTLALTTAATCPKTTTASAFAENTHMEESARDQKHPARKTRKCYQRRARRVPATTQRLLGLAGLVKSYDIVFYSDFQPNFVNLRGLSLGCIETDFYNQILIFQHFPRSTRCTYLCTAQPSKFQDKTRYNFGGFGTSFMQIFTFSFTKI